MKVFKITLVALAAALFSFTVLEQLTYSADNGHSRLGFSVKHMGISDFHGSFNKYESTIKTSKADFSDAVITLTADVASINTGIEMRDNHLKSEDFFNAEKFPTFTFTSTSFKQVKGNKYKVVGDLTMHGVTKKVELEATHGGNAQNQAKKSVAGFNITGVIKRSDFGIATDFPGLSDEVTLLADLEMVAN